MKIEIVKNKYGMCFAVDAETSIINVQFEWRTKFMGGPAWYFWPRKNFDPQIFRVKKKDFPIDFLKNVCLAKGFLADPETHSLTEEVEIVKGIEHLK